MENLAGHGACIQLFLLTVSRGNPPKHTYPITVSKSIFYSSKHIYPAHLHPLRTHKQYVADARHTLENGETRNGVKAANPVLLIKSFNIVVSFVVDHRPAWYLLLFLDKQFSKSLISWQAVSSRILSARLLRDANHLTITPHHETPWDLFKCFCITV